MKNSIEYSFDHENNKYFIWFTSSKDGALAGDIELSNFIGISEEELNSIFKNYHIYLDKIYPNSDYTLTYFYYEREIKEIIKILESYLISKLLVNE